jgi:hypothetical protein
MKAYREELSGRSVTSTDESMGSRQFLITLIPV